MDKRWNVTLLVAACACWRATGQTTVDLSRQGKLGTGPMLPVRCLAGQLFWKTDVPALYVCAFQDQWSIVSGGASGSGDFSSNTSTSVDSEVVLFSGTSGKAGKRASGTGIAKLTAGVLGAATPGTDYAPATSGSAPLKANGAGGFSSAGASDVIGLFSGCSGTQYLGADGACHTTATGGDASTNTSASVDSEVTLFSGAGGKTLKRATGTGIAKLTGGVLGVATSGTDYAPATSGSVPLKGNGAGGTATATSSDVKGLWSGTCDATTYLRGDGYCSAPSGNGAGGSAFAGSTAMSYSSSPNLTLSLADVSVKSPIRFEPSVLTANVSSVTFTTKTPGAKFSIAWAQDATGGRTVSYGGAVANTCAIDPTGGITTTQFFEVGADGATVNGVGCITDQPGAVFAGPEMTAPGTPAAGNGMCWFDNLSHALTCKQNNSATPTSTISTTAGGDLSGALPNPTVAKINGAAFSGTNGNLVKFGASNTPGDSGIAAAAIPQMIASGQTAMPTSAIAANSCTASTTAAAAGASASDAAELTYGSDPTSVTGYGAGTNGGLTIRAWFTANTINFKLCNETGGSISPGALSVNWRVVR